MTIVDFLIEKELTSQAFGNIVSECAKLNFSLANFLKEHKKVEIPVSFLEEMLESYNRSKVNIKTGEIIRHDPKLPYIPLTSPNKFTISLLSMSKQEFDYADCRLLLVTLDKDGKYIDYVNKDRVGATGITLMAKHKLSTSLAIDVFGEHTGDAYEEFCRIDTNALGDDVEEVLIYLVNEKTSAIMPFKDIILKVNSFDDNDLVNEEKLNLTTTINNGCNCSCFRIKFHINEWYVETINAATSKNLKEIVLKYIFP